MTDDDRDVSLPSAARWLALEPLLDAALARSPEERRSYLDEVCASDVSLRAEVGRLLAACERLDGEPEYLEQPAALRFATLWDDGTDEARLREAIANRYQIDAEIGRGGMAIVYRARDQRDNGPVALKVLRAATSAGGVARFRREIAVTTELRHPRILPLLESGDCNGRLWYTMPLVNGESLGTRLRRGGPLSIPDSVRLLRELCDGLALAHARGIVHRDLKPDNVLLADGHAIIADFGVAKALFAATHGDAIASRVDEVRTATGVGVGTPAYMAPEQAAGERTIDHRADLYALGVIAYEMLTGKTPFTSDSRQSLLTAHLAQCPAPLSTHRRDVPSALNTLVMQLLEKHAGQRPNSAAEVGEALAAIGDSLGTIGKPPARRWLDRLAEIRKAISRMAQALAKTVR